MQKYPTIAKLEVTYKYKRAGATRIARFTIHKTTDTPPHKHTFTTQSETTLTTQSKTHTAVKMQQVPKTFDAENADNFEDVRSATRQHDQ